MTSDATNHSALFEEAPTEMLAHRFCPHNLNRIHMKRDDETEVTVDETVGDLNESSSTFSLSSSSLHFPTTSTHCKWHGSKDLYELKEYSEPSNDASFSSEALDESFARDINEWNVLRLLGEGAFGQVVQIKRKSSQEPSGRCYALKILSKYQILCDGQIDDVIRENWLLKEASSHPFIVKLRASWQDAHLIYMLQDFIQGGELYSLMLHSEYDSFCFDSDRLPMRRALPERQVQFYTACIADALHYLHRTCHVIYRDLKPENVLIDRDGYPVLIDLGLAKRLEEESEYETRTLCGTPRYVAPEQIQGLPYSFEVDYWALGVLVYEMLTGLHPFDYWHGCDDIELYNSVTSEDYRAFDATPISDDAKDFVNGLLKKDPSHRLGCYIGMISDLPTGSFVQEHRWLSTVEVRELLKRNIPAPWIPELENSEDAGMYDDWSSSFNLSESLLYQKHVNSLTAKEQEKFNAFDDVSLAIPVLVENPFSP